MSLWCLFPRQSLTVFLCHFSLRSLTMLLCHPLSFSWQPGTSRYPVARLSLADIVTYLLFLFRHPVHAFHSLCDGLELLGFLHHLYAAISAACLLHRVQPHVCHHLSVARGAMWLRMSCPDSAPILRLRLSILWMLLFLAIADACAWSLPKKPLLARDA